MTKLWELTERLTAQAAGPRVLICEDEEDIANILREAMLQIRPNLRITVAKDCESAMAAANPPFEYDMAWIDIVLGGRPHCGLEVARRIRLLAPETPIVMCSGIYSEEIIGQAMEVMGATLFLKKPFGFEEIRAVLRITGLMDRLPCPDCPRLFPVPEPAAQEGRKDA